MDVVRYAPQATLGLDEHWLQKPTSASTLQNVYRDPRGSWESVGGYGKILPNNPQTGADPFVGSSIIHSLHWFSRHNGAQQFLVWEDGANLSYFNGSGTSKWTTLKTDRAVFTTPWQRTQYAAWAGWLYIINGYNEPIRFNGRHTVRCGFNTPPPAPVVYGPNEGFQHATGLDNRGVGKTCEAAGGNDVTSRYRYALTFVNDMGIESPLSAPSNEVAWIFTAGAATGERRYLLLEIPDGPSNMVAVRLYRTRDYADDPSTQGASQVYYFLKEFSANIRFQWTDGIPDDRLGDEMDASMTGQWPNGAKYIAVFKGTMFLAGMPEYPDRVVYSRATQHESYPPDNYLPIGDTDAGEVTAMYPTKNALVVFKRRGVYLIKGDPVNGFYSQTLTEDAGCHAPNALAELPGMGLVFLSDAGVHLLVGALENEGTPTNVRLLSDDIQDTWRDVNYQALMNASAAFYHRDMELQIAVPMVGSQYSNMVLVYHYGNNAWSKRPGIPANCMAESKDHRGHLFFGSHDTSASQVGVHAWARGFSSFSGITATTVYESAWLNFGRLYENVKPRSILLYCIGYGGTHYLDYSIDRRIALERVRGGDAADERAAEDPSVVATYIEWDAGTWNDGAMVTKLRPVVIRFDVAFSQMSCREFRFKTYVTGSGKFASRLGIIGYDVEIAPGRGLDVKPLNTLITAGVP